MAMTWRGSLPCSSPPLWPDCPLGIRYGYSRHLCAAPSRCANPSSLVSAMSWCVVHGMVRTVDDACIMLPLHMCVRVVHRAVHACHDMQYKGQYTWCITTIWVCTYMQYIGQYKGTPPHPSLTHLAQLVPQLHTNHCTTFVPSLVALDPGGC